jgi:hypothetical protein
MAAATSSQAMPLAGSARPDAPIIHVAGGCGPGFHRGPRGACLRNYVRPRPPICPRGYHLGPRGRCIANFRR